MKSKIYKDIKEGEKRTLIKFAWLPTKLYLSNTEHIYIWLEKYKEVNVYSWNGFTEDNYNLGWNFLRSELFDA